MDLSAFISSLFGRAVESAADWHSGHEARVADQVIAIALGSREGFVQYRGRLYLLPPEDVGRLLPGHRLSAAECRGLFGADGQSQVGRRLEPRAFVDAELQHEEATGLSCLEVVGAEGDRRAWRFPTRASAEDLFTRLEESGVIAAGDG